MPLLTQLTLPSLITTITLVSSLTNHALVNPAKNIWGAMCFYNKEGGPRLGEEVECERVTEIFHGLMAVEEKEIETYDMKFRVPQPGGRFVGGTFDTIGRVINIDGVNMAGEATGERDRIHVMYTRLQRPDIKKIAVKARFNFLSGDHVSCSRYGWINGRMSEQGIVDADKDSVFALINSWVDDSCINMGDTEHGRAFVCPALNKRGEIAVITVDEQDRITRIGEVGNPKESADGTGIRNMYDIKYKEAGPPNLSFFVR